MGTDAHPAGRHPGRAAQDDIKRYAEPAPIGVDEALGLALQRLRELHVSTRWSNASRPGAPSDPLPTDPTWADGSLYER